VRSSKTVQIEARLKAGESLSSIARDLGVSRGRVQQVKRRLLGDYSLVTDTPIMIEGAATITPVNGLVSHSPMKSFTVNLTTAVHDALAEACAIANRQSTEGPITIAEYTEELIINRVVELGLLRSRKKVQ